MNKAGAQGDGKSYYRIYHMLKKKDPKKARDYVIKACDSGYDKACKRLRGIKSQDYVRSLKNKSN